MKNILTTWFGGARRRVYLDYAAATPLDTRVKRAMEPFWEREFGNPSSVHEEGVRAREALHEARVRTARVLRSRDEEIIFASGGTESNNLAIHGVLGARRREGVAYADMHVVTSSLEHVSILRPLQHFEKLGVQVSYLEPDTKGVIREKDVLQALRKETVLVSLMYVNNEIGVVTPIRKIAHKVRTHFQSWGEEPPLVHTDASQAPLFFDCSPERLQVDLLTIDAQKIYGPKGVGMLYKKHALALVPHISGGEQEWGLRAGTEAVPLVAGFSYALLYAAEERSVLAKRLTKLRDTFIEMLRADIPTIEINGSLTERVPNNVSVTIPEHDMEFLVVKLDVGGVAASAGSACLSEGGVSHVVAHVRSNESQNDAIRFTLGKETTLRELQYAVRVLQKAL